MSTASYDPSIFGVRNIEQAKSIILTGEDSSTEDRWAKETPYLGELVARELDLQPRHCVLDFGCGIGRMAREIIGRTGCTVVGVDNSVSMRSLAPSYVLSDRFTSTSATMLDRYQDFHHALAIWTLQHIPSVEDAVKLIHKHLASYGMLFVVNLHKRAIPIEGHKWHDDRKDVREMLAARFKEVQFGAPDAERTTERTARLSFWGVYQKRT